MRSLVSVLLLAPLGCASAPAPPVTGTLYVLPEDVPPGLELTTAALFEDAARLTYADPGRDPCDGGRVIELSMTVSEGYDQDDASLSSSMAPCPGGGERETLVAVWAGDGVAYTLRGTAPRDEVVSFRDSLGAVDRDRWIATAKTAPTRASDPPVLGTVDGP